jgi:protein-S-isoprenylcysteine O-methyltransferase Ste14
MDPMPVEDGGQGRIFQGGKNSALVPILDLLMCPIVTLGIYSRMRHPVYLSEAVATLSVSLQYCSVGAALFVAARFGVQLWRMQEEEQVQEAEFPGHADYRQRTARVLPGAY